MTTVPAPTGFEGSVHWEDGTREWRASARPVGATWWTLVGVGCGHAHTIKDEVLRRAAQQINEAVKLGVVK